MKRNNETQTEYAIRLIREDERRECIRLAIWAVYDCGLPPSEVNLTIRRLMAVAVTDALAIK
jgi:hypothetical protein